MTTVRSPGSHRRRAPGAPAVLLALLAALAPVRAGAIDEVYVAGQGDQSIRVFGFVADGQASKTEQPIRTIQGPISPAPPAPPPSRSRP